MHSLGPGLMPCMFYMRMKFTNYNQNNTTAHLLPQDIFIWTISFSLEHTEIKKTLIFAQYSTLIQLHVHAGLHYILFCMQSKH